MKNKKVYTIEKILKTKHKTVFETFNRKEFIEKLKQLGFKHFTTPYIFSSVIAEGKFALREYVVFGNGQRIIISPEEIRKFVGQLVTGLNKVK